MALIETRSASPHTSTRPIASLRDIAVSSIVCDDRLQVRGKMSERTIKQYTDGMRVNVAYPPILVANVNGALVLVDGWHRLKAAKRLGRACIEANVLDETNPSQVRWMAAEANLKHGLPLDRAAKRKVFRAYVSAGRHRGPRKGPVKSSREMSADLGGIVTHQTIINWMEKDFPAVYAIMRGSEESPSPAGGLHPSSPDETLSEHALAAVEQLFVTYQGIRCPELRGDLIVLVRGRLADMEAAGEWTAPSADEPF